MSRTAQGYAIVAIALAAGCSTDTDLTNRPLFDDGVNVFEAQVLDGQTGVTIETATIAVTVGRHRLDAEPADGFFTVYGIPPGTFRVSATAEGYDDFEAFKSFNLSDPGDRLSDGDPLVYYFNNIVMYKRGYSVPGDMTVSVFDGNNGTPVANATVVASLTSVGAPIPVSNVLAPNVGLVPDTSTGTTGADGKAKFTKDQLVIGGHYEIDVFGALDAQGVYLVPSFDQTVTVGQQLAEVIVFLDRPYLFPVASRANNEDGGIHGDLTVDFPYEVELCSDPTLHTWFNSTSPQDTNFNGVFARPATTNAVTIAMQNNNRTLKLTANLLTGSDDPADDLRVTFSGMTVRPKGASQSSCTALTNVLLRNTNGAGATVNTEIRVRDVP